jgi:hypothetical protein
MTKVFAFMSPNPNLLLYMNPAAFRFQPKGKSAFCTLFVTDFHISLGLYRIISFYGQLEKIILNNISNQLLIMILEF